MSCKGCEQRRKAILAFSKRVAEWMKNPIGAPPVMLPIEESDSEETEKK